MLKNDGTGIISPNTPPLPFQSGLTGDDGSPAGEGDCCQYCILSESCPGIFLGGFHWAGNFHPLKQNL